MHGADRCDEILRLIDAALEECEGVGSRTPQVLKANIRDCSAPAN